MLTPEIPEDLLLSRAVERAAGAADWAALERIARSDPAVYRRLADTLRQESELGRAVDAAGSLAERIDGAAPRAMRRGPALAPLLGWAAAALFCVLWLAGLMRPDSPPPADFASTVPVPEAADPDGGSVLLKRLPAVVVGMQPDAETGALEVILIRRTLERARASDLRELCVDELGRAVSVPVNPSNWRPIESL